MKKTGGLATLLVWLLGAQAVATAFELLALANRYAILQAAGRGRAVASSTVYDATNALKITSTVVAALLILTVVIWCVWQHRAQTNAGALGTDELHFSPGWAVGWWFIPIADLWMPFRTVRELWKASHGAAWQTIRSWRVLGWWWALWLVSWVQVWSGSGSFNVGLGTESRAPVTSAQMISHDRSQLVALGARIVAALLAIAIVRSVTRLQAAATEARDLAALAPPPMPGGEPGAVLPSPPATPIADAMSRRERTVLTIAIVAAVCLSVGGLVWGSTATRGATVTGTVFEGGGIRVTYPADWSTFANEPTAGAGSTPVWSRTFTPERGQPELVLVNSYELTRDVASMPPDAVESEMAGLVQQLADGLGGSVTSDLAPASFGPLEGYHATVEGSQDGEPLTWDVNFVFVGTTEYEITCVGEATPSDQLREGCQMIKDTFAIS